MTLLTDLRVRARASAGRNRALRHERRRASIAYDLIRQHHQRPPLSETREREIRDYAHDVLGSTRFAPWLRVNTLFRGAFLEGWIPNDFFALQVLPNIVPSEIAAQRTLSGTLFGTAHLPDLAYLVNGNWFTPECEQIPTAQVIDHIFADCDEVYVKSEGSGRGHGVTRANRPGFKAALAKVMPGSIQNAVVQRAVKPCAFLAQFHPTITATIRITTTLTDAQGPRLAWAILRVGQGRSTHLLADEAISWHASVESGKLADLAYGADWKPHQNHPECGVAFQGVAIPEFGAMAELCKQWHMKLPHYQLLAWDLSVDERGKPMLFEWNGGHVGVILAEMATGPNLRHCKYERFARSP